MSSPSRARFEGGRRGDDGIEPLQSSDCWESCWCWDDRNNRFPPHRRFFLFISFLIYLLDVGLDAWVAVEYYIADQRRTDAYAKHYLTATLIFIVVPSVILNFISWALYTWGWLVYRNEKVKSFCRQRLQRLKYVEDGQISRDCECVPIRGVLVMNWPKTDNKLAVHRQMSSPTPHRNHTDICLESPSWNGTSGHQRRSSSLPMLSYSGGESEIEAGESEIDSGLEFYPLDLMDWSEYVAITILHLCLLGYLFRILRIIYVTTRTVKDNYSYDRYRDISFLRLVESFMESAPQLVLQLYLLVVHTEAVLWYRIVTPISIIFSIFSLALSVADYISASKDVNHYDPPPHQKKRQRLSWPAYIVIILWHLLMIISRGVALSLFATVYGAYIFLVIGLHYMAMVYWMYWQQARVFKHAVDDSGNECHSDDGELSWKSLVFPCKKICNNYGIEFIVAAFNIFFHFKIRDGGSRYTLIPFYVLTLIENVLMIFLWYFGRDYSNPVWYAIPAIVTVFVAFFVGLVFLILYYQFGQPSQKGTLTPDRPMDHPVMTATLSRMYDNKVERGNFFKRLLSLFKEQ